jgi:hypothetical protein
MIMADLRITGVTNNQLELQAPDGTRHYLEISPDLVQAIKSKPSDLPSSLTPREIQAEIRLGTTVAELVAKTGADEDQVAKFAAPIITELKHIVTLARNIRLSLAGDRFTDPTQIEFGTVMDERLSINRATDVRWVSKKSVEGVWLVSAEYLLNGEPGVATWSFDPKNLFLVPENQSALLLSNASPLSLAETSKQVKPEQVMHPTVTAAQVEPEIEISTPTAGLTIVPELTEVETTETHTEIITVVETETRTTFHVVEDHHTHSEEDIVFIHEDEEPAQEVFEEPIETTEKFEAVEPVEPTVEEPQAEEPVAEQSKPQSTSRWAEVLFGTKDDEDDK